MSAIVHYFAIHCILIFLYSRPLLRRFHDKSSDTKKDTTFNKCARDGIEKTVEEYEKEYFDDSSKQVTLEMSAYRALL